MENVLSLQREGKPEDSKEQLSSFFDGLQILEILVTDPPLVSEESLHSMIAKLHAHLNAHGKGSGTGPAETIKIGEGESSFSADALAWRHHQEAGQNLYILNFDLVSLMNRRKISPMVLIDELMEHGQILDARLSSPLEKLGADFKDYPLFYEVLYSSPADQTQLALKLPRVEFKPATPQKESKESQKNEKIIIEEEVSCVPKTEGRSEKMSENKARKMVEEEEILDEDDEDSQKDKYLTFRIANEDYGLEIAYVTEIVGIQGITEVPDMPDFVRGVINLRGQVIPVIDVRLRFRLKPRAYDDRTCVVVVNVNNNSIGLIVDTVNEVLDIPADQVSAPPKVHGGANGRYIQGMGKVGDTVKILLDVNKLLFEGELQQLAEATA